MIYLDDMGHCFSDESLEELYEFCVVKMGLRAEWNHYSRDFPHFDIRYESYRLRVIELGGIAITNRQMVALKRKEASPFKGLHDNPHVPIYQDLFRGKAIKRIDFEKYFSSLPD